MSQGPAIPTYVLRGHVSPVQHLLFLNSNALLASGDSDGWLIIWSIASKRPFAVWKAHEGGVTGIRTWAPERLITHGRDHKLRVWKWEFDETSVLSTKLPVDGAQNDQPQPWLLHSMDVSALNFCTFAICNFTSAPEHDGGSILIASPNGLDSGGIDVFQLPIERRILQLHAQKDNKTGMVMAIAMFHDPEGGFCLLSGYEDGRVMVHTHHEPLQSNGKWQKIMDYKAHTQPTLSLELSPLRDYFITSSADAAIAKFPPPKTSSSGSTLDRPLKTINTKHAGQQGLSVRSDGKIFATAGWDARVRVYSSKTMKELAVLKWHKDGCASTLFAHIHDDETNLEPSAPKVQALVGGKGTAIDKIKQERNMKAQRTHWLAVGGKDGKISLWDIY